MFTNKCIGTLDYESVTSAIVMAGLFLSFIVEYLGHRVVQAKVRSEATLTSKERANAVLSSEVVSILVMEVGILFHSLRMFFPPELPKPLMSFANIAHSHWADPRHLR